VKGLTTFPPSLSSFLLFDDSKSCRRNIQAFYLQCLDGKLEVSRRRALFHQLFPFRSSFLVKFVAY